MPYRFSTPRLYKVKSMKSKVRKNKQKKTYMNKKQAYTAYRRK